MTLWTSTPFFPSYTPVHGLSVDGRYHKINFLIDGPIDSLTSETPTQFHWNDYSDRGYMTALELLQDLQREGQISALGLCNFDTIRMDEICTTLGQDSIVSNQVQVRSLDSLVPSSLAQLAGNPVRDPCR